MFAHVCTSMILYRPPPPVNRGNVYLLTLLFCFSVRLLDHELSPVLRFFCTRLHLLGGCIPSVAPAVSFKSPLHKMTQTTPTSLWNDSASIEDLTYSIE